MTVARLSLLLVLVGCSSPDNLDLEVQDTSPPRDEQPQEIRGCYKTFLWTNPTQGIRLTDGAVVSLGPAALSHGTLYFSGDYEWQERVEAVYAAQYQTFVWQGDWAAYLTVTHVNGLESEPSNTIGGTC